MKKHIAIGVCALLLAMASCSDDPAATPSPTEPSSEGSVGKEKRRSAEPEPIMVKRPWRPGKFQHGIQLYWHRGTLKADKVDGRISDHLDYIIGLGANSLGVTFPIYTDGVNPSRVYRGRETPSISTLRSLVRQAHIRGMRVMLRPLIDEENIMITPGAWRGTIEPPNVEAWFASYRKSMAPYLRLAQDESVEEFVLGTELFSLQDETSMWTSLRQEAMRLFKGRISYGLNWDGFAKPPPFQQLGLDLYPSIDLGDKAPVALIARELAEWLRYQPVTIRRRITLQEVGIAAVSGAYREPWLWGEGQQELNLEVQAKWFAAACLAARQTAVQGLYYWMVDSNVDPTEFYPETSPAGSFMGRPAERRIKDCYTEGR